MDPLLLDNSFEMVAPARPVVGPWALHPSELLDMHRGSSRERVPQPVVLALPEDADAASIRVDVPPAKPLPPLVRVLRVAESFCTADGREVLPAALCTRGGGSGSRLAGVSPSEAI